ncbi:MAG: hypothetical protein IPG17_02785 [Sandaracinaceae bacterium]|nr:hypothetical protein [Sandaracinaceae bacterium]
MRHTGPEPVLRFPAHPLHQSEGFRAAIALFRVGDTSRARWALDALAATAGDAQDELLWVTAALYEQAGDRTGAMQLIREHSTAMRRVAPVGHGRAQSLRGVYSWLDSGSLPAVPDTIPPPG